MQSDRELIEQIRERNAPAFEVLFERYRHLLLKHILHIIRDERAAEDLVQEVFLRVWTSAAQWDGRGELRSWLYRIADVHLGAVDEVEHISFPIGQVVHQFPKEFRYFGLFKHGLRVRRCTVD